ncbi:hypothetical protein BJ166DRAFT_123478 [Pestalotiopsis sp. NC0098]|nr:hypothetical protein BJ166DRAFT_123478 [Pestalotiopsis sp. NC0098]
METSEWCTLPFALLFSPSGARREAKQPRADTFRGIHSGLVTKAALARNGWSWPRSLKPHLRIRSKVGTVIYLPRHIYRQVRLVYASGFYSRRGLRLPTDTEESHNLESFSLLWVLCCCLALGAKGRACHFENSSLANMAAKHELYACAVSHVFLLNRDCTTDEVAYRYQS